MRESQPEQPLTLRRGLERARAALRDHGISEWQIEAEALLRHVVSVSRSDFLSRVYGGERHLTRRQLLELRAFVERRLGGEPLAYIVGRREFYGLDLEVNESVLIPRQETETLVELALEYLGGRDRGHGPPTIVDVGTGSGAVALAVATHPEGARIVGVDISRGAIDVAARNRDRLSSAEGSLLRNDVEFVLGDMLTAMAGPVDLIVSNPPYVPSRTLESLAVEVRREPRAALDGGPDGLDYFRKLTAQAGKILAPGGVMIVELMPEQMDAAASLASRNMRGVASVSTRLDLMGNRRVLVVETEDGGI